MATCRVLFIDDDENIRTAVNRYFTKAGYQVFTAENGREGVKEFNKVSPDVTVVDLNMPDITGMHVLEELRPKKPMIIMLTSEVEIENAVEAMRRGAENFLTKPISMSHLEVAIQKAAEKAVLGREVTTLRARLRPSTKRKVARAAAVLGLVGASVVVGLFIGGSSAQPEVAPIPVPFDPQDTVIQREESSFRPIPLPEKRDPGR